MGAKDRLRTAAVAGLLLTGFSSAFAENWTLTSAPITNWASVASSADGRRLVAAASVGLIYISTNAGSNWTPTSAPSTNWTAVASSSDGSRLAAAAGNYNGSAPVYVSTNHGVTWTDAGVPYYGWMCAASSADGIALVVGSDGLAGGWIFASTNGGTTWPFAYTSRCHSIASSADGQKLAAVWSVGGHFGGGNVSTSTNGGATWSSTTYTGSAQLWESVACSADGTKLVAGTASSIYTSPDFGITWIPASTPVAGYYVASSADATRLVAAGIGAGQMFASTNSGANWTQTEAPAAYWHSVASSADGCKLVAAAYGGGIYTLQTTLAPVLSITPSGSNFLISWIVPSMPFVLQENADLNTPNWTAVPMTPILNLTNLHHEVTAPLSGTNRFYRLKSL